MHGLGWGTRRIAARLGCSRTTVRHYVSAGEWAPYRRRERPRKLADQLEWLRERLSRHRGNADVVRQDLARELGITVSLRTLEREVAPLRQALAAEARATLRFETPPGKQPQIDFGETRVALGDETVRVHLFVARLGYSRRLFVQPYRHERQSAWFDGLEATFRHFGGVPREVLVDNPRALVDYHDAGTREVADVRRHGTTEEAPQERFERTEFAALRPLSGRPPFNQLRDLVRTVTAECAIELDANSYSVPRRLIGQRVQVVVGGGRVQIRHAGVEVASHAEVAGRRQRIVDPAHFHGVSGVARPVTSAEPALAPALLRPLAEYEHAVGGGWS